MTDVKNGKTYVIYLTDPATGESVPEATGRFRDLLPLAYGRVARLECISVAARRGGAR